MKPPVKKFLYKLDTVFNFGKHKHSTVKEVIVADAPYIKWCLEEVDNFELDNEAYKMYEECYVDDILHDDPHDDFGWGDFHH